MMLFRSGATSSRAVQGMPRSWRIRRVRATGRVASSETCWVMRSLGDTTSRPPWISVWMRPRGPDLGMLSTTERCVFRLWSLFGRSHASAT